MDILVDDDVMFWRNKDKPRGATQADESNTAHSSPADQPTTYATTPTADRSTDQVPLTAAQLRKKSASASDKHEAAAGNQDSASDDSDLDELLAQEYSSDDGFDAQSPLADSSAAVASTDAEQNSATTPPQQTKQAEAVPVSTRPRRHRVAQVKATSTSSAHSDAEAGSDGSDSSSAFSRSDDDFAFCGTDDGGAESSSSDSESSDSKPQTADQAKEVPTASSRRVAGRRPGRRVVSQRTQKTRHAGDLDLDVLSTDEVSDDDAKPQDEVTRALRRVFGHTMFRPGQEETIRRVIRGESAMLVAATGTGKSLCFQLPAVLSEGVVVVISPLGTCRKCG